MMTGFELSTGHRRAPAKRCIAAGGRRADNDCKNRSPTRGPVTMSNSFGSRATLTIDGKPHTVFRLAAVEKAIPEAARLPFSLKILLENLLRTEDGVSVRKDEIEALARWNPTA